MLPAFVCYGIVCCVTHFIVENFIHLTRVVNRKSQVLIPLLAIHGLLATCVYAHSPLTIHFSYKSFFTKLLTDNQHGAATQRSNVESAITVPVTVPKKSLKTAPV